MARSGYNLTPRPTCRIRVRGLDSYSAANRSASGVTAPYIGVMCCIHAHTLPSHTLTLVQSDEWEVYECLEDDHLTRSAEFELLCPKCLFDIHRATTQPDAPSILPITYSWGWYGRGVLTIALAQLDGDPEHKFTKQRPVTDGRTDDQKARGVSIPRGVLHDLDTVIQDLQAQVQVLDHAVRSMTLDLLKRGDQSTVTTPTTPTTSKVTRNHKL